jgi:hypothetical protein
MGGQTLARRIRARAIQWCILVAMISLFANVAIATSSSDPDTYGQLDVPGSATLHFPKREVEASFTIGLYSTNFHGLDVPPLQLAVSPARGGPGAVVTKDVGGTATEETDHTSSARIRIWRVQIPRAGDYRVDVTGTTGEYPGGQVEFGHAAGKPFTGVRRIGLLVAGGLALVALIAHLVVRRSSPRFPGRWGLALQSLGAVREAQRDGRSMFVPTPGPAVPDGQDRIDELERLAALHAQGALTDEEFAASKARLLGS